MLGHGGIVVFDDTVEHGAQARFAFEFCAKESCGKCTPCRIGATRGEETIDKIIAGRTRKKNIALLRDLCEMMTDGSLCAMGGLTPHAGAERAQPLPRGFRPPRRADERSRIGEPAMALIKEIDFGTPIRVAETTGHPDHRRRARDRAEGNVGHGRRGADGA